MPRVPTYDDFQVGNNTQPMVQAESPDFQNFAAEQAKKQGQAMQQFGGEVGKIALDMQDTANSTRIKEAENDAVKYEHVAEYGDGQNGGMVGFQSLQGKAALERPDRKSLNQEVSEAYDKHIKSISSNLGNEAQKELFNEVIAQRKTAFLGRVDRHVMHEYEQHQISVAKGTVEVGQNQITLSWGEPARINEARGAVLSGLQDEARLQGWSKEELQAETVRALSPSHLAVITQAVDAGKADYAREYYAQNKEEMLAGARLNATRVFDIHDDLATTQAYVDEIYAMDVNPQDKIAEARNILDPKQRAKTVAGLKARFREDKYFQQRGYEEAANNANKILAKGGSVPASVFLAMDGKTQLAFEKMQLDGERPKENDPDAYYKLVNMPADTFAKVNLGHYVGSLKPATWEVMVKKQKELRNTGDYSFRTQLSRINSAIESLGISKKDKGAFYERADKWAQKLGHDPTDDELSKWIASMNEVVLTDEGYILNSHEKIGNIHTVGIPDSEIAGLVNAITARGGEASSENIKKLYSSRKNVIDSIGASGQR